MKAAPEDREKLLNAEFLTLAGLLLFSLCGSCTVSVVRSPGENLRGLALLVGGVPTLVGLAMMAVGVRRLWRMRQARRRK